MATEREFLRVLSVRSTSFLRLSSTLVVKCPKGLLGAEVLTQRF
uniref:Uncharacterized protein n=1 Tax=Streptomyces kanamyceticus TaxID=1967 RepID=E9KT91_STRKN|nr:hypothetical protein Tcs_SK_007 [Streptomyces kanamyceticus]